MMSLPFSSPVTPLVLPAQRGMDRGELAAFLFTAERTSPMHAALAVLLGLNGLRVSEACGANVENLGFERGHRTLQIVGKGNKPAGVPLVPRTARTLDLAIGERTEGPILVRHDGHRLDPRTAYLCAHSAFLSGFVGSRRAERSRHERTHSSVSKFADRGAKGDHDHVGVDLWVVLSLTARI
jgi:integrase